MRLFRFGPLGQEKPGVENAAGQRLDVSAHVQDYDGDFLAKGGLERLEGLLNNGVSLPEVPEGVRLGAPVARPHKFIGIGLNYRKHAEEAGFPIPTEPVVFTKHTSAICGPNDDVIIPPTSQKLDYEVELAFVMKDRVKYLKDETEALEAIAGYTICNDISERYYQLDRGGQWVKGKSHDTFGPLGPYLVPANQVDPSNLKLKLSVNGQTRQEDSTADLIFGLGRLVCELSEFMTLEPGDVVTTGTPAGVAMGMKPPKWLQEGDVIELEIEGFGQQRQKVVKA